MADKMLQLKLPAAHSVRVPAGEAQGFASTVFLGRAPIFGHEENNGLQDSPRAGCPCGKGGEGREEPAGQLQTCWNVVVVEEIRDFLEW